MENLSLKKYLEAPSPITKELKIIFSKISPTIFFDIGGCEGEDSIRYSILFPNAEIYTFEPLPKNFKLAENNFRTYNLKNATPVNQALSDKIGVADFYVSSGQPPETEEQKNWDYGNKSSSLFKPNNKINQITPWLKFNSVIKVKTNTIDNFCKEKNINKIDFIHMDVQGAELSVLRGGINIIKKIKAIWLEVESIPLYKNQPLKNEVEKFFKDEKFFKVTDTIKNESGDQLYINSRYYNIYIYFIHL